MKILTYIILLISLSEDLFSSDIYINNKIVNIPQKEIGRNFYIEPDALRSISKEIKITSGNKFIFKNSEIKFSTGSFFIVYESDSKMLVHQMSSAPVDYDGKTYLPVIALFNALKYFNIFDIRFKNNDIYINSNTDNIDLHISHKRSEKQINKTVNKEIEPFDLIKAGEPVTLSNIAPSFFSLSNEIVPYFDYKKNNDSLNFRRTDYPPNIYLLPQNLKRE